jgi:putative oxidoreductase
MSLLDRITVTSAGREVILIRLIVGGVFLSEGIQKFLFPNDLGVGRFSKIGIPSPEVLAPFVGVCEIVCGALILIGLLTRVAAVFDDHRYAGSHINHQDTYSVQERILGDGARGTR